MSSKKIVLITGANSGIGFATVKALYASSTEAYHILLGCRNLEKGQQAIQSIKSEIQESDSDLTPLVIDIESDESIKMAFENVSRTFDKVDVLINNAGGSGTDFAAQRGAMPLRAAFAQIWDLNVTGSHMVTHTFAPLLVASPAARLIFITSGISTLTGEEAMAPSHPGYRPPPPAGWPKPPEPMPRPLIYRAAKTGLNMIMLQWVRAFSNDGVMVCCVSPGFLATGSKENVQMMKKIGAGDASIGGELIRDVVQGKRDGDAGKVITKNGIQAW